MSVIGLYRPMVAEALKFVAFTLTPLIALLLGIGYSIYEIYYIGEKRVLVIVLILGFMSVHQAGELQYFLETGIYRDPVGGELPETAANLIAATSVYYVLALLRNERQLNEEYRESQQELREATNRLESIFDNVNDGILLVDLDDGDIVEANRAAHEQLRYDSGDLVGMSPLDIHPHEPELFHDLTEALRVDGGVISEQLSCRRGDGTTMPAAISASRPWVNGREVMLVTIRDNSFRERYRAQLDLFTRVLRHNLRNDMNVVRGYLEVIRDRADDETASDLADKGIAKCERLVGISEQTRRLREILRTEYREFDTAIDLVPLVGDIADGFAAVHSGATIETNLPDSAPVSAHRNLTWAVENVVENAIVYAESDPEVYISVEDEHVEYKGIESEWTTITVADRGPGIPESEVAVLEDDDDRTDTEHGSGLGLWITKQIVEIFGGRIEIDREPESSFSTEVRLRLQPGADETV